MLTNQKVLWWLQVINFKHPHELAQLFDFSIPDQPKSLLKVLQECQHILNNCVKTGHPRFFNQLSQGLDLLSLAGEFIAATTNTNMFTYEIAPVYNLMEQSVLMSMRKLCGWQEPGDGIFNPGWTNNFKLKAVLFSWTRELFVWLGGSISNLNAIQVALYSRFPDLKEKGVYEFPKMTIFTSAHVSFSVSSNTMSSHLLICSYRLTAESLLDS